MAPAKIIAALRRRIRKIRERSDADQARGGKR
jgi:hypothetical protein